MSSVTSRLAGLAPPADSRLGYLLRLSRPRFWFYLAGPAVVGVVYAADSVGDLFTPLTVGLFAYFLVPANVFLYGVNDVFDADVDEQNPKKEDREVRYRGGRDVVLVVVGSGVLGVAMLPFLPTRAVVGVLVFLALAIEYSAPPFRFKTTPFLDSLSNGLYVLPGVVAYAAVAGAYPPGWAVAGGWLWTMAMHTFSAVPDIEPDRAAGIRTTATVLGQRWTDVYCGVVWLLAAWAFLQVHPFLGGLLGVYPVFLAGVALSDVAVDRAYWWFPFLNTAVGAVMTNAALWRLVYGP
ncbi:lycopene elongase [Halobacteriales archaeon QS_4_69_31]|nr:MAG: lycopene elongase [Halobacteriales archaeon QS_4_69_31]